MKGLLEGSPEEIAALVVAIQERRIEERLTDALKKKLLFDTPEA